MGLFRPPLDPCDPVNLPDVQAYLNTATNFVVLWSLSCAVLLLTAAVVWIRIDTHIPENQPAVYLEMGTQAHLNIPPIC